MGASSMRIEKKQIQLIHIAQAQLFLSDDNYRSIIAAQTKGQKHSSKDLTYLEADAVINYFVKTLGFKIKSKYVAREKTTKRWRSGKRPANVYCLASRDQLEMVNALAGKIVWKVEDGFRRWMKKYIKIDSIKTEDEASDVIEGLKGMLANQEWKANNGNNG